VGKIDYIFCTWSLNISRVFAGVVKLHQKQMLPDPDTDLDLNPNIDFKILQVAHP
jgi:hypothetical protein